MESNIGVWSLIPRLMFFLAILLQRAQGMLGVGIIISSLTITIMSRHCCGDIESHGNKICKSKQ